MRFLLNNILIVLFVLITFSNCKEEEGLPKQKIAHMYVDILIAEQTYQFDLDSLNSAVENVFVEHGISKEIYDGEVNKFNADEKQWKEFFDLAQTYLDSLKTKGRDPDS